MTKLPEIIGLPPLTEHDKTDNKILDSMPRVRIYPMESNLNKGIHFMRLRNAMTEYQKLLGSYGFQLGGDKRYLDIAFLNEGSISDGVSSDYGDSFLSKFANAASEGLMQVRQITNSSTFDEMQSNIQKLTENFGEALGGKIGSMVTGLVGKGVNVGGDMLQSGLEKLTGSKVAENLLIGNRIDLPQVWKGSSSSFDYGITVRLYNPNPSSEEAYLKYIVGPIAAFLLFCMPRSPDGQTYRWPFFCKAYAPGLFKINFGAIKDISITKGGDASAFTYKQQPSIVDVKLSITELYTVRLALEEGAVNENNVPTLKDYLDALKGEKETSGELHFVPDYIHDGFITSEIESVSRAQNLMEDKEKQKLIKRTTTETTQTNRVSGLKPSQLMAQKPQEQLKPKQSNIYGPDEEIKIIRLEDDKAEKEAILQDTIKRQYIDMDPNDDIERIGENTYINHTTKKVVIDANDYKNISDANKDAKKYADMGYSVVQLSKSEDAVLPSVDVNIVDLEGNLPISGITSTVSQTDTTIEKVGQNTLINHSAKTAIIDRNDFKNPFEAKSLKRNYEKKGYTTTYIN